MKKSIYKSILILVLLLFLFSVALTAVLARTSFNLTKTGADISTETIRDILQPLPESVDAIYTGSIEEPMEDCFQAVGVVGYCFTTPKWPATKEGIFRVREELAQLVERSSYISTAFLYNSATDQYVSSLPQWNSAQDQEMDAFFREVIYAYNSGSSQKQQLNSTGHLTFRFSYNGSIFIAKDLTTRTGQSLSTLFVQVSDTAFTTALSSMFRLGHPYTIHVYDENFNLILSSSNSPVVAEIPRSTLLSFSESSNIATDGSNYLFYYTSEAFHWQYVIIVGYDYLQIKPSITAKHYFSASIAILLLITLIVFILFLILKEPLKKLIKDLDIPGQSDSDENRTLVGAIGASVEKLVTENVLLRTIVDDTSEEVMRSLFGGLFVGQHYESDEIARLLTYTKLGFSMNDVYVAACVKPVQNIILDSAQRHRIFLLISDVLNQFREKQDAHAFVFAVDTAAFAIIVAYPQDRSIAEGKALTTMLFRALSDRFRSAGMDLSLHFGHLYHSILDVGFSFSEAERSTQNSIGSVSPVVQDADIGDESKTDLETVFRRATQIAELLHANRETEADALIRRTVSGLFQNGSYEDQCLLCKSLLSAFIEKIVSYEFINHSQLSDVAPAIYRSIQDRTPKEQLKKLLYEALSTLSTDFSALLKKQRNPYVKATLDYIDQHYSNVDLSLDEIAQVLGVAPNYLSNLFSRSVGVKLFDYINDYRIKKSVEMLLESDKTINEISLLNGFGTSRNYIRVFKKYMNTTPGAYRKQQAGIV